MLIKKSKINSKLVIIILFKKLKKCLNKKLVSIKKWVSLKCKSFWLFFKKKKANYKEIYGNYQQNQEINLIKNQKKILKNN